MTEIPTPGQIAYQEDLKLQPLYHDGTPRLQWHELGSLVQNSWERNPTPRTYGGFYNAWGDDCKFEEMCSPREYRMSEIKIGDKFGSSGLPEGMQGAVVKGITKS